MLVSDVTVEICAPRLTIANSNIDVTQTLLQACMLTSGCAQKLRASKQFTVHSTETHCLRTYGNLMFDCLHLY